jgi:AcrR family transcriptional regulator
MSHSESPEHGTRERLLDAAERLFAEEGIRSTSLRRIIREAGANLAAVHYHFGSKAELVVEVLARRIRPMNAERLRRLDRLEAEAAGGAPRLGDVLRALLGPALVTMRPSRKGPSRFRHLMVRLHTEGGDDLRTLVHAHFAETLQRFSVVVGRCCPHLSRREIMERMKFTIGAMAFSAMDHPAFRSFGEESGSDTEPVGRSDELDLDRLVAYVEGGFRAAGEKGEGSP